MLPALVLTLITQVPPAELPSETRLVVLRPTGVIADGLPVLERHPDEARVRAVMERGFSGRLLRLFAFSQHYLQRRRGQSPQPAYLALTSATGGFPRVGFTFEGTRYPNAGWVDLRESQRLTGRHGSPDQIFPHELMHVIARQLAGPPRPSGGNQIHAVGVRTDQVTAFHEGLAEHLQIMAIDDPDADSDTAALRGDEQALRRAQAQLRDYQRDLTAPWAAVARQRLRFPLWYGSTEQVLRYHAVRNNAFGHAPADSGDRPGLTHYLSRSVVPPELSAPRRSPAVQLSIDGPVAHLFWTLVTDHALQHRYRDAEFYADFGVGPADLTPLDNVYLKLFAALAEVRPSTTAELLRGWSQRWPDDHGDLDRITREALGGPLPDAPEIWLASDTFVTGTTVFDQFASLARRHTFDANAAEVFDWLTVPGITGDVAHALVAAAPFSSFDALRSHAAVTVGVAATLTSMHNAMNRPLADSSAESLSFVALFSGLLWRVALLVAASALLATWLARLAGTRRGWAALSIGLTASALVFATTWGVIAPVWFPAAVLGVCALPWSITAVGRRRSLGSALIPIRIWFVAALPAFVITWPW